MGTFFPLLATASKAKVLFESEGEAAMAAKAFSGGAWDIPEVRSCFVLKKGFAWGVVVVNLLVASTPHIIYTYIHTQQSVTFAGLTSRAVAPDDDVVFLVEPINRSGSPVILTVRHFVFTF